MEALYKQQTALLVSGLPHDEYLKTSGRVQAIEAIYNLIETLDTQERQLNEHKRNSRDTTEQAARIRDLAFAGSQWWQYADRTKP